MTSRRNFIKKSIVAGIAGSIPSTTFFAQEKPVKKDMIWANLLHLSVNMWKDTTPFPYRDPNYKFTTCEETTQRGYRTNLLFDEDAWNAILKNMAAAGLNMVLIDLGDAVVYDSHPEIAVKNAWTPEKLRNELSKIRKLGIEPIPKLNFSTGHDTWLGEYSRMVSTKKYYEVCRNLIHEVINIFDTPRFFHLGMDEEDANNQRNLDYVVIRQNDLWWGDFYFLIGEVEKKNVRSWIWSDYAWSYPDLFFKKMPKSVLQSNWYYGNTFDLDKMGESSGYHGASARTYVELYHKLEAHGYDQIPTGSNWNFDTNMEATVEYCKNIIAPSRLLGFMTAPWRMTLTPCLGKHQDAINQLGRSIKKY